MKNLTKSTLLLISILSISLFSYSQNFKDIDYEKTVTVELENENGELGKCISFKLKSGNKTWDQLSTYEMCGLIRDELERRNYECKGNVECKSEYALTFGVKVKF